MVTVGAVSALEGGGGGGMMGYWWLAMRLGCSTANCAFERRYSGCVVGEGAEE